MKVFYGVKKGIGRSISALTRIFGVECDIYFPTKYNNTQHGFKDNDISYNEDSDISSKLLIPSIFKNRQESYNKIMDPFSDGDIICYTTVDFQFPRYSKVVTRMKSGVLEYIIDNIETISDDEGAFFYKYALIPYTGVDVLSSIDEINDSLELEYDNMEDGLEHNEDVVEKDTNVNDNNIIYEPIK